MVQYLQNFKTLQDLSVQNEVLLNEWNMIKADLKFKCNMLGPGKLIVFGVLKFDYLGPQNHQISVQNLAIWGKFSRTSVHNLAIWGLI